MDNKKIGRFGQIRIYVGTLFRLFITEKQWTNFVSTLIIMVLISLVTSKDVFSVFKDTRQGNFAVICACIWVGLFNSIRSICKERPIIKREHRTGLHISAYVLAHVVYEFVLSMGEALIVILFVYGKNMSNFPEEGLIFPAILDMYISFVLIVFASDMLALLVSCIVKNENSAMTVMPFVLIIQLIMSGVLFDLDGIAKTISSLTISRWGLDAILSIANTSSDMEAQYIMSGLADCDPTKGNLFAMWLILIAFCMAYIGISILVLENIDRDKR